MQKEKIYPQLFQNGTQGFKARPEVSEIGRLPFQQKQVVHFEYRECEQGTMSHCIYLIEFNIISKLIALIQYQKAGIMITKISHLRKLINPVKQWAMYGELKNDEIMRKKMLQIEKQLQKKQELEIISEQKSQVIKMLSNKSLWKSFKRKIYVDKKYSQSFVGKHHKKIQENHRSSKPILGNNYEFLNTIELHKLYIVQLMDIVSFFNCNIFIEDISTRDSIVTNFIDRLSLSVKNRWNNVGQDRLASYLTKIVRCSQTYSSKQYPYFLNKLHKQIQDLSPFMYGNLSPFIECNRNGSEQTLLEIKILIKAVDKIIEQKWLNDSLKVSVQTLNRIIDYSQSNNFIQSLNIVLDKIKQQASEMLLKRYKQLSTPELSLLILILLRLDPKNEGWEKISRIMNSVIKETGETSLDPNLYIFYQFYCKDYQSLNDMEMKEDEKWIKVFIYYLKGCKTYRIKNLNKFTFIIENGIMKLENRLILIKALSFEFFKDIDFANFKLFHMRTIMMIKFCIKYHDFQTLGLLITKLLSHNQYVSNYFSSLLTNINLQIFKQLCPESKDKLVPQVQSYKFTENLNIYYLFIKNIINMLSLNLEYEFLFSMLNRDFQQIPKELLVQIFKQMQHLPIPLKFHANFFQVYDKCFDFFGFSDDALSHRLIYHNYKSVRDSKLKVELFMALLKKNLSKKIMSRSERNKHFLKIFCNNRIRQPLTIYLYQQFVEDFLQIIQQELLQSKEYQFTMVRIFSDLAKISNNFSDLQKFLSRINHLKFGNAQIFSFFYNIIQKNRLPKLFTSKINQIRKKNWKVEDSVEKQLNNYERVLDQILKIQKNQANISVLLYLLELYNKEIEVQLLTKPIVPNALLKDLVRTTRLVYENYKNNGKVIEKMGKIFKQNLNSICLRRQTSVEWKFEALKIGYQINIIMPEVFHQIIQITQLNPRWHMCWRIQSLLQLIIQYPVDEKWNNNFVVILTNLLLANPSFKAASLINEKMEKFKQTNKLSEQSHSYIKFLQNKLKN